MDMNITEGQTYTAQDGRELRVTTVAPRLVRFVDVAVGGLAQTVSPLVFAVMVDAI